MKRIFLPVMFLVFFVLGTGTLLGMSPDDAGQFKEANQRYRDGKYQEATLGYEKLLQIYPEDEILYYNLGNSCFRSGQLAKAILSYERALRLNPRNGDTRKNLAYVNGMLDYKVEDKRNWYLKAGDRVLGYITFEEIVLCFLGAVFLFLVSLVYSLQRQGRIYWSALKRGLIILCLITGVAATFKNVQNDWVRGAIIMTQEAEVRYGPSVKDHVAFRLGEGLKVYVVKEREDWSRVLLANGETGWIDNSQIELI